MTVPSWITVLAIVATIVGLAMEIASPPLIMLGTLGLLLFLGVLTPQEAFAGFANEGVITVGALFVVSAGLQSTGALTFLDRLIFPKRARLPWVILRMSCVLTPLSAFLNNTPVVAMLLPRVQRWAEKRDIPSAKLMIPLSYLTITGGMVTLLGTSTNLTVSGLLMDFGLPGLGIFSITWLGLPVSIIVTLFLAFFGYHLLPNRNGRHLASETALGNCLFELRIAEELAGKTIQESGLRSLEKAYVAHIVRSDAVIPATPEQVLQVDDILVFVGSTQMIDALLERPGLQRTVRPPTTRLQRTLPLFEAVIAPSSGLVGKTLREVRFRERYGGVVLGIQRRDQKIASSIGRTVLKAGDLLLIEAPADFDQRWNPRKDEFYLVAPRQEKRLVIRAKHAPVALLIFIGMILTTTWLQVPLSSAAFAAALGMVLTRCLTGGEARQAIDLQILVVIAAALGIGRAVDRSGLAEVLGGWIAYFVADRSPITAVAIILLATMILTEVLTNNAAAALMIPISLSVARAMALDPVKLATVVAIGASAGFITPIGYQTNLMVMSPGGYRFQDFAKVGAPVSLLTFLTVMTVVTWFWF